MLAALIAKKKTATQAAERAVAATKFPVKVFVDMAMIWDGWHKHDPVGSLMMLADWLAPEGMSCLDIKATPIPSVLSNWQVLALSNMTEVSQEQIWTLILTYVQTGKYRPKAYVAKPAPERNTRLIALNSMPEDF